MYENYNKQMYKNYLMHKGKKGMKWGYNDGERNGKRTAGEGESYLELLERVPADTEVQRKVNGKTYNLSGYKNGTLTYTNPDNKNDTVRVKQGKQRRTKQTTIETFGGLSTSSYNSSTTTISEGSMSRFAKKAKKWMNSFHDKTITTNMGTYVKKGKITKAIERGKKRVNKFLDKLKFKV